MKRTLYLCLVGAWLCLMCSVVAGAQSLGDVARQQRQHKRPSTAKVITNDEIASSPEEASPAAKPEAPDTADAAAKAKPADKAAKPAEDGKDKAAAALQAKANDLKKSIAQLERELNLSEREYKLRAATYYADAGNSLRDPKAWAEQERQYQAEKADKQKALDEAKQKLTDLQEQARKMNVRIE